MDVKYINPFLNGTMEVLKKMAFIDAVPGRPFLKKDEFAHGDVSGIIGITGDAIGSLALSFSEACICGIVAKMLGEEFHEVTRDILDATGEITNMVSGSSRTQMEKMGMSVYAAIPTVVHGNNHTVSHILKSPSIVIPFSTPVGKFVIDVCIKMTDENAKSQVKYGVVNVKTMTDLQQPAAAVGRTVTETRPLQSDRIRPPDKPGFAPKSDVNPNEKGEQGKPVNLQEVKDGAGSKRDILRKKLNEAIAIRGAILKELSENPFMEITKRRRLNKELPIYDQKIERLKLDIRAVEMLAKMSQEDDDKQKIPTHYQNYDSTRKR